MRNLVYVFYFFYRNINDVLSCFSDSPPTSPMFPDGGNPVLYGEEDNKVRRANCCQSHGLETLIKI